MAIKIAPEYVSVEDFRTYTGINLHEELADGEDPQLFLRDREDEIIRYVNLQSWRPITRWIYEHKFSPDQVDAFREAILIQAKYVFLNGNIFENSGIDPEMGVKFGKNERESAAISQSAIDKLMNEGIITLKMRTRF